MRVDVLLDCVGDPVGLLRDSGVHGLEVVHHPDAPTMPAKKLHPLIAGADGVITSLVTSVDAAFLDAAGPNLKVVSNYAVGHDNIDLDAAASRGVVCCYGPPPMVEPTADMAWLLLLAAARRAREGLDLSRSEEWSGYHPTLLLGHRLLGGTLLVVGAGRIGSAIARRAQGWNMNVLYVANSEKPHLESEPINATRVTLEEGLAQADCVMVSVALNQGTRKMISGPQFDLLKPHAILVNVSRGPVIDESAMVDALERGQLFGVGLDVYEEEPTIHPGLLKHPRAFIMPHLGSATIEDRTELTELAVENVLAVLKGSKPPHQIQIPR